MYFLITLSELPEVCKNPSLLETIKYLFYIIKIITILTPIILIVALMIRLVKAFLKDDEVNVIVSDLANKLLLAVMIFIIPTILTTLLNITGGKIALSKCVKIALNEDLVALKEDYETLKKSQSEAYWKELEEKAKELLMEMKGNISGSEEELVKMIKMFEGTTSRCPNDSTKYKAVNYNDGTITVGPGITKLASGVPAEYASVFKNMKAGDCISEEIVDYVFLYIVKNSYMTAVTNNLGNCKMTEYQIHALTDLSYNRGGGTAATATKKYCNNGTNALISYIKTHTSSKWCGWAKRRDQEIELFMTGVYPTDGYNRKTLKYFYSNDPAKVLSATKACGLKMLK